MDTSLSSTKVKDCIVCKAYRERRAHVLAPHIAKRAFIRGVAPVVVASEYLFAVHSRHLAGKSLSTRTHTPDKKLPSGGTRMHVMRSCNGCQKSLGDVTEAELVAAVSGAPLPDVRVECGCYDQGAAA
jgi:hypothetical protein